MLTLRDAAASAADPVALVRAEKVIVTEAAIKEIRGVVEMNQERLLNVF